MTRDELVDALRKLIENQQEFDPDVEVDHQKADGLLLTYIADPEVTQLFLELEKWYA